MVKSEEEGRRFAEERNDWWKMSMVIPFSLWMKVKLLFLWIWKGGLYIY